MVADDATLLEMREDRSMSKGGVDAGRSASLSLSGAT